VRLALANERRLRGWTQKQLAALTGIAQPDLSAVERGHVVAFPGWRRRLVAVFGLPEAELFAQAPDMVEAGH
jgi:transcriptional regulator with XRE-family HTH domain